MRIPKPNTKAFVLLVEPSREALEEAIAQGGRCDPKRCWHKVAIHALMDRFAAGAQHHIRIDSGHAKLNYAGWRYIADLPLAVKRSLIRFDRGEYELLRVQRYKLRFRRTTKIKPNSNERTAQINAARRERAAAGKPDKVYSRRNSMRFRVEGLSGIV